MTEILAVAIGASASLLGVWLGSWFTGRRQDRMWLKEQKLKAAVDFTTAGSQLFEQLRGRREGSDGPGINELAVRLQDGRSALHLLCRSDTAELADDITRQVFHTDPSTSAEVQAATVATVRRFTMKVRREIES
ncbi:hypothetical protein [Streptomyces sp. NPDC048200]|uniref:hypothetical protein n=1 Tax=Streptomyces sp. NPDC048200 TaxID=3365512 RepID=UPI0037214FCD